MTNPRNIVARFLTAVIRKEKGQYCVRSPNNPDWNGGCYESKDKAEERLREVEYFKRQADLSPPLGDPGGPCQVTKRIHDEVSNPGLRDKMIQEVEHGQALTNQEASKVYDLDRETGAGVAKQLEISAHAQYRMDLRSVTVEDVKQTLARFTKSLETMRSKSPKEHGTLTTKLMYGDELEFIDPQTRLDLVFKMKGMTAVIITAFWKGKPDPVAPRSGCPI